MSRESKNLPDVEIIKRQGSPFSDVSSGSESELSFLTDSDESDTAYVIDTDMTWTRLRYIQRHHEKRYAGPIHKENYEDRMSLVKDAFESNLLDTLDELHVYKSDSHRMLDNICYSLLSGMYYLVQDDMCTCTYNKLPKVFYKSVDKVYRFLIDNKKIFPRPVKRQKRGLDVLQEYFDYKGYNYKTYKMDDVMSLSLQEKIVELRPFMSNDTFDSESYDQFVYVILRERYCPENQYKLYEDALRLIIKNLPGNWYNKLQDNMDFNIPIVTNV